MPRQVPRQGGGGGAQIEATALLAKATNGIGCIHTGPGLGVSRTALGRAFVRSSQLACKRSNSIDAGGSEVELLRTCSAYRDP